MTEALAPYAWRDFTSPMLARRVVGAADRYSVVEFLAATVGTEIAAHDPVEAADVQDERVDVLVEILDSCRWRAFSLDRLCLQLLAALDEWQLERDRLDAGLRRLLGEG